MTKDEMYPATRAYIAKAYSKHTDYNKLIKQVMNRFAISEQSAKQWIQLVVGVGQ